MKATEMTNKPRQTSRANRRGTLTGSGLDLETKIFSPSGRGRTFFLTSLFIELSGSIPLQPVPFLGKFNLWRILVAETPFCGNYVAELERPSAELFPISRPIH